MENNIFNYNGNNITMTFKNGNVYVNATEMAKSFDKQPAFWLRTQQSKDFINSYCAMQNCIPSDLVKVANGDNGGTWMHEDIALAFAQWLSPEFYILCNSHIKELLKHGMTATQPTLEAMVDNPDLIIQLATNLKKEREEKERIRITADTYAKELESQTLQVLFSKAVEGAKSSCLIGELAKIIAQNGYPIGEKRMFQWLRDNSYLGKHGERYNVPNQQYVEQGLFEIKKGVRSGSGGVMHTTITTKVTGKGQIYFVNKFLRQLELA